jgi:hypothetical protein
MCCCLQELRDEEVIFFVQCVMKFTLENLSLGKNPKRSHLRDSVKSYRKKIVTLDCSAVIMVPQKYNLWGEDFTEFVL